MACILAIACLFRPEIQIHGLLKLGMEVLAGITVYYLNIDLDGALMGVYAKGAESG